MRGRMGRTVKALLFIAILSVFAADISVGCGQNQYVYGPVQQKFSTESDWWLRIQDDVYQVPYSFYNKVEVGDIVKGWGQNWTIVKRASEKPTPQPNQETAPSSPSTPPR